MVTITENYVSFEIAKLLKEKGFDESLRTIYRNGDIINIVASMCNSELKIFAKEQNLSCVEISAPTQAMAMRWLREVHNIHIEICLYKTNKDDIEPKKSRKAPYYTFGVWDTITGNNVDKRLTNDFIGDIYEETCEAAIKYCLENLI